MKNSTKFLIVLSALVLILGRIYYVPIERQIKSWLYPIKVSKDNKTTLSAQDALFSVKLSTTSDSEIDSRAGNNLLNLAVGAAAATSIVMIDDCISNPVSVKSEYGDEITFKNIGKTPVVLNFPRISKNTISGGRSLVVKNSDLVLKPLKPGSISVTSYSCEGKSGPVGYITILY